MAKLYIIGAGLAGLSAAVTLAGKHPGIHLLEAAPQAGGRCRAFHDTSLNTMLDNGNHLLLSVNRHAMELITILGSRERFQPVTHLPFHSLHHNHSWEMNIARPLASTLPGISRWAWLQLLPLLWAGKHATIAGSLRPHSPLCQNILHPLAVSICNTPPEQASARLFRSVMVQLIRHYGTITGLVPRQHWQDSLIDPALAYLQHHKVHITYNSPVQTIATEGGRVSTLVTRQHTIHLTEQDQVILATPPWVTGKLLKVRSATSNRNPHLGLADGKVHEKMLDIPVPEACHAIVNVHFAYDAPDSPLITGITGGQTDWVFRKQGILSTTTSAADRLAALPPQDIARQVWQEIQHALAISAPLPPYRVIKEKRATFACTPATETLRPGTITPYANLFLAGDYTATGLPATIEGAIVSGKKAAHAVR